VCLLLLFTILCITDARAQGATPADVSRWSVWGARHTFAPDAEPPGGTTLDVGAYGAPGVDWSSGAGMAIPTALKTGERLNVLFWARASLPARVPVTIQGDPPAHAVLTQTVVALTPEWQCFTLGGAASSDLAAGSQHLTLLLGKTPLGISLGPVLFLPGEAPDETAARAAFATFQPAQIVRDVWIPSPGPSHAAADPGVTLAGRLRLPGRSGPGPYPVVILLDGSGPGKRGVFRLVEDRLLAGGIATLDYDKRGVGDSTGDFLDTLDLMVRDATAAAAYVRTRPDIDGTRVALLGLSQGAYVGPAVAAHDPAIAAVVMLAGPAGEQGTLFIDGAREKLALGGIVGEANERVATALRTVMQARTAGARPAVTMAAHQALIDAFIAGGWTRDQSYAVVAELDTPVVLSMYQATPDEVLARIRAPVLALYAGRDSVVSTPRTVPQARAALRNNPDATVIELPGLNHGFQQVETGQPGPLEPVMSAPEALDLVARWLDAHLHPATPAPPTKAP
jgi:pimeloyl-ACP methyl ester carboxylesterase